MLFGSIMRRTLIPCNTNGLKKTLEILKVSSNIRKFLLVANEKWKTTPNREKHGPADIMEYSGETFTFPISKIHGTTYTNSKKKSDYKISIRARRISLAEYTVDYETGAIIKKLKYAE